VYRTNRNAQFDIVLFNYILICLRAYDLNQPVHWAGCISLYGSYTCYRAQAPWCYMRFELKRIQHCINGFLNVFSGMQATIPVRCCLPHGLC